MQGSIVNQQNPCFMQGSSEQNIDNESILNMQSFLLQN